MASAILSFNAGAVIGQILVMGGTRFIGRPLVAELLESGHQLTLFTRGDVESVQCRVISSRPMTTLVPGVQRLAVGRSPCPGPPSNCTSIEAGKSWSSAIRVRVGCKWLWCTALASTRHALSVLPSPTIAIT